MSRRRSGPRARARVYKSSRLDPAVVRDACLRAAEMLSGMGYTGKYGSFHLLDLNLQSNTVTAIFHNMVAWQISRLDSRWNFHAKGGSTPDLTNEEGSGIQIKATSNTKIKGNKVSANQGYYVAVKYSRVRGANVWAIEVKEILMGELKSDDWKRMEGTQWAILKPEAEARMQRIYP